MSSEPAIHAVVEVGIREAGLWVELPAKPWPDFIRLWGSASPSDVAFFLAVLSSYGRSDDVAAGSADELLSDFPDILPGGLAVISSTRNIMPSCCCGLEHWSEWKRVLQDGQSPWTGHDPAPLVEVVGDQVRVWSDGGMGGQPEETVPVTFSRADFAQALAAAETDLKDFLGPLRSWLDTNAPQHASQIIQRFNTAFVERTS